MLPFALAVTMAHLLVLGLPIALLYRAKRWQQPGLAVATGFLVGTGPAGIYAWPPDWAELLRFQGIVELFSLLGVFGGLGAAGALVFWLTLRWAGALDETPPSSE